MGEMIRRVGAYSKVVSMFYMAVTQAVLLFVSETWVLSVSMEKTVDVIHTGFLKQITGKKALRKVDGTWSTPKAEEVQEEVGTQTEMTHIGIKQETAAQWVVLPSIFKACERDMGCEGGGNRR